MGKENARWRETSQRRNIQFLPLLLQAALSFGFSRGEGCKGRGSFGSLRVLGIGSCANLYLANRFRKSSEPFLSFKFCSFSFSFNSDSPFVAIFRLSFIAVSPSKSALHLGLDLFQTDLLSNSIFCEFCLLCESE